MRLFMINRYLCHLQKIPPLRIVMLKEGEKEECVEVCGKRNSLQWMVTTRIVHGKLCDALHMYYINNYQFMESMQDQEFLNLIYQYQSQYQSDLRPLCPIVKSPWVVGYSNNILNAFATKNKKKEKKKKQILVSQITKQGGMAMYIISWSKCTKYFFLSLQ